MWITSSFFFANFFQNFLLYGFIGSFLAYTVILAYTVNFVGAFDFSSWSSSTSAESPLVQSIYYQTLSISSVFCTLLISWACCLFPLLIKGRCFSECKNARTKTSTIVSVYRGRSEIRSSNFSSSLSTTAVIGYTVIGTKRVAKICLQIFKIVYRNSMNRVVKFGNNR